MAVLAASDWPNREQAQQTHAVHPQAKQTRYFAREFAAHPAVTYTNRALAAGAPVNDLFTAALRSRWPTFAPAEPLPPTLSDGLWLSALADFHQDTAISNTFWPQHEAAWYEAQSELAVIFQHSQLAQFLGRLSGRPLAQAITILPNLVYPALTPVVAPTQLSLFLILPPPKAVGESPPWPFAEDPGWALATACGQLTAYLLADTLAQLDTTQQILLKHAATTLFLEQEIDDAEALAYQLRSRKEQKLPRLPLVVEALRNYLTRPGGRTLIEISNW
jgi:hypothetical protein